MKEILDEIAKLRKNLEDHNVVIDYEKLERWIKSYLVQFKTNVELMHFFINHEYEVLKSHGLIVNVECELMIKAYDSSDDELGMLYNYKFNILCNATLND